MKTLKELKADARKIVTVLNSTGPNYDKYPWGNLSLKNQVLELEVRGLITYSKFLGTWRVGK